MLRVAILLICFNVLFFFDGWSKIDYDTSWLHATPMNWPWWAILAATAPVIVTVLTLVVDNITSDDRKSRKAK